jgi:hypothetical protein
MREREGGLRTCCCSLTNLPIVRNGASLYRYWTTGPGATTWASARHRSATEFVPDCGIQHMKAPRRYHYWLEPWESSQLINQPATANADMLRPWQDHRASRMCCPPNRALSVDHGRNNGRREAGKLETNRGDQRVLLRLRQEALGHGERWTDELRWEVERGDHHHGRANLCGISAGSARTGSHAARVPADVVPLHDVNHRSAQDRPERWRLI